MALAPRFVRSRQVPQGNPAPSPAPTNCGHPWRGSAKIMPCLRVVCCACIRRCLVAPVVLAAEGDADAGWRIDLPPHSTAIATILVGEVKMDSNSNTTRRPRVVIIGGGFGGIAVARKLAGAPIDILLIDRNNYHAFWPLMYQVATAGLDAEDIVQPIRGILRDARNVQFRVATVQRI